MEEETDVGGGGGEQEEGVAGGVQEAKVQGGLVMRDSFGRHKRATTWH